jgi:hypothetical protein
LTGSGGKYFRVRPGNRLRKVKHARFFCLTKVNATVQFLKDDQFGTLGGAVRYAPNGFFHVGLFVRRATLLYKPDFHDMGKFIA